MHACHDRGQIDDRICFGIGRDLYGRPKNWPTIDKVIVRNPGCTLLSDMMLFFGMTTHFWPLTVCLSRRVYRVCRMLMHASTLKVSGHSSPQSRFPPVILPLDHYSPKDILSPGLNSPFPLFQSVITPVISPLVVACRNTACRNSACQNSACRTSALYPVRCAQEEKYKCQYENVEAWLQM